MNSLLKTNSQQQPSTDLAPRSLTHQHTTKPRTTDSNIHHCTRDCPISNCGFLHNFAQNHGLFFDHGPEVHHRRTSIMVFGEKFSREKRTRPGVFPGGVFRGCVLRPFRIRQSSSNILDVHVDGVPIKYHERVYRVRNGFGHRFFRRRSGFVFST